MAEKKIIKQAAGFMHYDDGSKETIADYRARLKKTPLKSDVKKALDEIEKIEKPASKKEK